MKKTTDPFYGIDRKLYILAAVQSVYWIAILIISTRG